MGILQEIRDKYPEGVCCEYIDEIEKTVERYEKALQVIYNIDAMFLTGVTERPYNIKEAHDEMIKTAEKVLYGNA